MRVLISIHDVTPAFHDEVSRLDDMCRAAGLTPALLVVPDWHGQWPLETHPRFIHWLRDRVAAGSEIILHGERHDEVGLPRGVVDHLRAAGRTAREGEFLTLDHAAARQRIDRGVARLRALGLEPLGFIPPAWLCRDATHQATADVGLRFSEDERGLRLHPSGIRVAAPAVRWSARSPVRAHASGLVAAARWRWQRTRPLMRLALHPSDLGHPATRRSVEQAIRNWATHSQLRYAELGG